MGWLIALAIVLLIVSIPVGALVQYDSGGFLVRLIVGFFRFTLIPFPKRKKKPTDKADAKGDSAEQDASRPQPEKPASQEAEKKGGSYRDFLPLMELLLDFLNQFRKKLRVNRLELKLILAGDDPCDLAVNYGRAWAALGNLLPMLERGFLIEKRDCEVECDFTADQTLVIARMEVTLRLGQLAALAAVYGFQMIKELLILKKKRKGGAVL